MAPSAERASTNATAAVLRALSAAPDATAAGLSEITGLGRSTVAKVLAGLAARGEAVRTPGGRDVNRRLPDRWNLPEGFSADTTPSGHTDRDDTTVPALHAVPELSGTSTTAVPVPDADEPPTPDGASNADATEGGFSRAAAVRGIEETTDGGSATEERDPRSSGSAEQPKSQTGLRLGRGQLRAQVHAHLAAYPNADFTPHEVGRVLGRSAGAVANALAKLTASGDTIQTSDRPRRYRLAQAPQAAQ